MNVRQIDIDKLVPYARNPRNNSAAVDKVAASLREFGWKQPIVVDSEMTIVAGHTRLLAAKKINLLKAPVVVADDLTPQQVKAYRLADNRIAEESTWDVELLGLEIKELDSFDLDLSITGFEDGELDRLLNYGGDSEQDDEVPAIQEDAITVSGDVWQLGKHRLLCGDCTVATDVGKLLGGVVPTLMVTDPPYGVNYDPDWRNRADRANGKPYGASAVGIVTNDDKADWTDAYSLFPGDVAYVWHAGNKAHIVANSLIASGLELRAQVIWSKNNIVIGRGHYHPQHEPCWYAVRKGATGHWCGSRKETTVWNIDKPMKSETGHSTQKPVECMRRPIVNNTSPGQAVYDPFMGSGTTIIAGEKEGRPVYGIEINPLYVDVCVRRWQEYTGKEAHIDSGETFSEIENARRPTN